ncbi:MAG TPA: hypothetical protein VMV61_03930 [Patescibacteria group bacterium]|nr:hypothetical protein [Patescibacteria group bacterium]
MSEERTQRGTEFRWSLALAAALAGALLTTGAVAQEPAHPFSTGMDQPPSGIQNVPPKIPVEEIIQKFGAREDELKRERDNYTYEQTFVIQTVDADGQVDGEERMSEDIVFTPEGKRYEHVTDAPAPTLQRIMLTQEDLDDLIHIQPFVLTTDKLPLYDIQYLGQQHVDELDTYVFDVAPKKIEKHQRYFQGRIWVDQRDMEIVKTYGKAVPDIRKGGMENVFPRFETLRENIESNYWFPTYTHADDYLHFAGGNVHIRMTVRYRNYKRYGVQIKIGTPTEVKPDKPQKP